MSDVFISYSRLEREFVGKLREELANREQDIWIDWESIPPSQAWWAEIQKGIARANNFVVMLSPNSVASPVCQMEIEYARQLGKRIIPVLHLDFNRENAVTEMAKRLANPDQSATRVIWGSRQPHTLFDSNVDELKHINYFFFRPEDDFQTRFDALFTVIRTDYGHKEQHTTLELRAQEWQRRNHNVSFLLLDDEMEGAQAWMRDAVNKQPPPTDLQRNYVAASVKRTQQLRNIRRASIIGSIVAVFALVFAGIASLVGVQATNTANVAGTQAVNAQSALTAVLPTLTQANQQVVTAEGRADAAGTQIAGSNATLTPISVTLTYAAEQVATNVQQITEGEERIESLRLIGAANTELQRAGDSTLATLLTVRAMRGAETTEGWNTIGQVLQQPYRQTQLKYPDGLIGGTAAYSLDGRHVAIASQTHKPLALWLWNVDTGLAGKQLGGFDKHLKFLQFSADGTRLFGGTDSGMILEWDVPTGDLVEQYDVFSKAYTYESKPVAISPNGRYAAVSQTMMNIQIADLMTNTLLYSFQGHSSYVNALRFSPDSKTLASGSEDSTVRLWDVATGKEQHVLSNGASVSTLAFSDDGSLLATGSGSGGRTGDRKIRIFRLQYSSSDTPQSTLVGHADAVTSVAFDPFGRTLASSSVDGSVLLWDITAAVQVQRLYSAGTSMYSPCFAPDGKTLLTLSPDTSYLWNMDASQALWRQSINSESLEAVVDVQWDTGRIAFDTGRIFDGNSDSRNGSFSQPPPEGKKVVTAALAPDDGTLYYFTKENADSIGGRLHTGKVSVTINFGGTINVLDLYFAPDGRTLYLHREEYGGGKGELVVVDRQTGRVRHRIRNLPSRGVGSDVSPDGQWVTSCFFDSEIDTAGCVVIEIASAKVLQEIRWKVEENTGYSASPQFTRDGLSILWLSDSRTAALYDVATGKLVRHFEGHSGSISSLTLSKDGTLLATGGGVLRSSVTTIDFDGTARVWNVATGTEIRRYNGHRGMIQGLRIDDTNRTLTVLTQEVSRYSLISYSMYTPDLLAFVCTRLFRDFTPDERTLFGIADDQPSCPHFGKR